MKILFLVYHTLSEYSGITKKILSQKAGFEKCGADVFLCSPVIAENGAQARFCNGQPMRLFGKGLKAKILKRVSYSDVIAFVRNNSVDAVYVRHDINASPFTIRLFKKLKELGTKVILEIPTWPYDGEMKGQSKSLQTQFKVDLKYRQRLFALCDKIVTFSNTDDILGFKPLNISNGVDFEAVPMVTGPLATDELRLLSVANVHLWHGLDRLLVGMGEHKDVPVKLHIVGDGLEELFELYKSLIEKYGLQDRVWIFGPMYGENLDHEFQWANMGVGSLGRHRSGVYDLKTLKNREYAARGLSFFYSENDSDFDNAKYVFKVPADETPVDVEAVFNFYKGLKLTPEKIRQSIGHLSWENQMKRILDSLS